MPIKKSALLFIVLMTSSVSLVVFSSDYTPEASPVEEVLPLDCQPSKCCTQMVEPKTFSTWDMVSQIVLRTAA